MSEDISAQIRVGITVVLVAALVAVVLSLMTVGNSILESGMQNLTNGTDKITEQKFNKFAGKSLKGNDVIAALDLFGNDEIAVVIRTKACVAGTNGAPWAYNYVRLLDKSVKDAGNESGIVYKLTSALKQNAGDPFYTCNFKVESGAIAQSGTSKGTYTTGDSEYVLQSAPFWSELIKDETGKIVGMIFTQKLL